MQIKEYLLQNCQLYMQEYIEFLNQHESRYGMMAAKHTTQFAMTLNQNGRMPIKLFNQEIGTTRRSSIKDDGVLVAKGVKSPNMVTLSDERQIETTVRSRPKF
jgi:hypothetical protein